jgi:hypothetical protein
MNEFSGRGWSGPRFGLHPAGAFYLFPPPWVECVVRTRHLSTLTDPEPDQYRGGRGISGTVGAEQGRYLQTGCICGADR